jgi:hypothetical protein
MYGSTPAGNGKFISKKEVFVFMTYEPQKQKFKVPDAAECINNVTRAHIKAYSGYFKVQLVGDSKWGVRLNTARDVELYFSAVNPKFKAVGRTYNSNGDEVDIYTIDSYKEIRYDVGSLKRDISSLDTEAPEYGDPIFADQEPVKAAPRRAPTIEKKSIKKESTMNFNMIKGVITFDKKLAFNVDGKYKYVNDAGAVAEILPQFVLMKDIPALVPTVADKITKGVYYTNGAALYYAKEDNMVINLNDGIVTTIAVSSIPMTDKVIVYKPLFGTDGKIDMKGIIQAQMLGSMGNGLGDNPMAAAMLLGDGEFDVKTMAMLSMANGGKFGEGGLNGLLPLMLLDGKGDKEDLLPLLALQGFNGKDQNPLASIFLLKAFEKDSKKDKKD